VSKYKRKDERLLKQQKTVTLSFQIGCHKNQNVGTHKVNNTIDLRHKRTSNSGIKFLTNAVQTKPVKKNKFHPRPRFLAFHVAFIGGRMGKKKLKNPRAKKCDT